MSWACIEKPTAPTLLTDSACNPEPSLTLRLRPDVGPRAESPELRAKWGTPRGPGTQVGEDTRSALYDPLAQPNLHTWYALQQNFISSRPVHTLCRPHVVSFEAYIDRSQGSDESEAAMMAKVEATLRMRFGLSVLSVIGHAGLQPDNHRCSCKAEFPLFRPRSQVLALSSRRAPVCRVWLFRACAARRR